MTTESTHPVPTGLLARYVSLGDEGYVLWCGPIMREVAALEAELRDRKQEISRLMQGFTGFSMAEGAALQARNRTLAEHLERLCEAAEHKGVVGAAMDARAILAIFLKEEKP